MVQFVRVRESTYFDSVTLMLISSELAQMPQVKEAAVMMGTEHNKRLMLNSGVLDVKNAERIHPNDLVIGILAETQETIDQALKKLDELMAEKNTDSAEEKTVVHSLDAACERLGEANFTVISLPGAYAGREAMRAMQKGLHVLLFSDNVDLETEIMLKDYALEHGLLMMGPDCGTAMINGVALGFANRVRRGNIGLVAAAGTGLQEVTTLIHRMGGGVSQALGTGGRDGKDAVGGKMLLQCIDALEDDRATDAIGIISKPLGEKTLQKLTRKIKTLRKPTVVCFLGASDQAFERSARTLEEAAAMLCKICGVNGGLSAELPKLSVAEARKKLVPEQKYLRGLYSGGTLCYETMLLLQQKGILCFSNISQDEHWALNDPEKSEKHTLVDMGEDYFTNGMPHPMIDPRLRAERIVREGLAPETAVILLDCVLGYGSNADPAGELAKAIQKAQKGRASAGEVIFVASICGTDEDIQCRSQQKRILEACGVEVFESNAQAALYVAALLQKEGGENA